MYICDMPRTTKDARFSARLTKECKDLIEDISREDGISESAVVEQSVRKYAEIRGFRKPRDIRTPSGASVVNETGDGGAAPPETGEA